MKKKYLRANNSHRLSYKKALDLYKKDQPKFWKYAQECFHNDNKYYGEILLPMICNQVKNNSEIPYSRPNIIDPIILT